MEKEKIGEKNKWTTIKPSCLNLPRIMTVD